MCSKEMCGALNERQSAGRAAERAMRKTFIGVKTGDGREKDEF